MPSRRRLPPALPLAALALLVAAGCGGDDEPARLATVTTTVTETVTTPAATAPPSTPAPDTAAPLTLREAERSLDARGYATLTARDFRPGQPLKVLVGIRRDAEPRAELAFFFYGDRFLGTDTKDPSARIEVVDQSGTAVTLAYALYRPGDAIDAPSGGTAAVTYRWSGTALEPQDPIPPAAPGAPLSRR
jgi:hypothetical protein